MTAIFGYARVSTTGQDLGAAGLESIRIFTDKLSESAKSALSGLTAMLNYARSGDTVVCHGAPSQILLNGELRCAP